MTKLVLSDQGIFKAGLGLFLDLNRAETLCGPLQKSLLTLALGHGQAVKAEKMALDKAPFPPAKLQKQES